MEHYKFPINMRNIVTDKYCKTYVRLISLKYKDGGLPTVQ